MFVSGHFYDVDFDDALHTEDSVAVMSLLWSRIQDTLYIEEGLSNYACSSPISKELGLQQFTYTNQGQFATAPVIVSRLVLFKAKVTVADLGLTKTWQGA